MPCTFLIFGASGDLTSRKLIPAIYQLSRKRRLPPDTRVLGVSRTAMTDGQWRAALSESTQRYSPEDFDQASWAEFARTVFYVSADASETSQYARIEAHLKDIETNGTNCRVYYLSTAPSLYERTVASLGSAGMANEQAGPRRIVVEKPFGTNLDTCRQLNQSLHTVFNEKQIYRIDHYLGKETVQNLLVLRFANSIFEPIWNRNYVDHVQITVSEDIAVGRRGAYYDASGILRDMFQNHLLQLMTITAMESPARYNAEYVRNEKVKVLQAVRLIGASDLNSHTLFGQYEGYRDEEGVPRDSRTPTFAAIKLWIDNWRWQDVPFYLRSGKAMSCRTTQIVVQFRQPPHRLFPSQSSSFLDANRLVIQIQPAEGIQLHFRTKVPDAGMNIRMTDLDFRFTRQFAGTIPDAYQRLLLDAAEGDASLFLRSDEVELAWGIIDPIVDAWQANRELSLETYPQGDWGPAVSPRWMQDQGRDWFDVCPVLS